MFKFHLQPVLNHRQFIEDTRQKEYVLLKTSLGQEQDQLARLAEKKRDLSEEMHKRQHQGTNSAVLLLYNNFLGQLNKDINQQEIKIAQIEEQTRLKRAELLDAMKDRKALEKFKEKKAAEHMDLLNKQEQAFLDEIGINRHGRTGQ